MNKELFDKLDKINDTMFDMDIKVKRINEMLEELIKALHNYDEGYDMFEIRDYTEEAIEQRINSSKIDIPPCSKHDAASWEHEAELNKRMDVIGQNGNEGLHYDVEGEFDDYGKRVGKDKDNNDPAKRTGESKPLVEGKNKSQHKHGTGKTQAAPPPKPPKYKSAIDEHIKYPPHKH